MSRLVIKNLLFTYNTFAKVRCFGNEERFSETPMLLKVSGNTLRFIPETTIKLAKVYV